MQPADVLGNPPECGQLLRRRRLGQEGNKHGKVEELLPGLGDSRDGLFIHPARLGKCRMRLEAPWNIEQR